MLKKINFLFFFTFVCFGSIPDFAAAQSIVVIQPVKDPAAVYEKPDFDSKIIYLLPKAKKVYGTKSTKEGSNGLGLFHKVKLNSKTFGYMLDTEVQVLKSNKVQTTSKKKVKNPTTSSGSTSLLKDYSKDSVFNDDGTDTATDISEKSSKSDTSKKTTKSAKSKTKDKDKKKPEDAGLYFGPRLNSKGQKKKATSSGPLIFNNLIGGQIGIVNYAEDVGGLKKKSSEWLVGFKMTGPNWLFSNLLSELSVSFHYGAPKFFDDFATDASGFFIITDLTFPFILRRSRSHSIYGGIGPMLNASFFDYNLAGDDKSSKNLRLGGVATLGIIYELGDWALKAEPKYYFEGSSYWGVLAGLQKRF